VLSRIAEALTTVLGPDGVVGRFGGDEFVAFRPVDGVADARRVADNARWAVAGLCVRADGPDGPQTITGVTVSIGVAVGDRPPVDVTTLWWAADRALYAAKQASRNTGARDRHRGLASCRPVVQGGARHPAERAESAGDSLLDDL